jgi:hypothetical protein
VVEERETGNESRGSGRDQAERSSRDLGGLGRSTRASWLRAGGIQGTLLDDTLTAVLLLLVVSVTHRSNLERRGFTCTEVVTDFEWRWDRPDGRE